MSDKTGRQMADDGRLQKAIEKIAELEKQLEAAIKSLKRTYRKHWLSDDSIGWDELGDELMDVLCNLIGDVEFQKLKSEAEGQEGQE